MVWRNCIGSGSTEQLQNVNHDNFQRGSSRIGSECVCVLFECANFHCFKGSIQSSSSPSPPEWQNVYNCTHGAHWLVLICFHNIYENGFLSSHSFLCAMISTQQNGSTARALYSGELKTKKKVGERWGTVGWRKNTFE